MDWPECSPAWESSRMKRLLGAGHGFGDRTALAASRAHNMIAASLAIGSLSLCLILSIAAVLASLRDREVIDIDKPSRDQVLREPISRDSQHFRSAAGGENAVALALLTADLRDHGGDVGDMRPQLPNDGEAGGDLGIGVGMAEINHGFIHRRLHRGPLLRCWVGTMQGTPTSDLGPRRRKTPEPCAPALRPHRDSPGEVRLAAAGSSAWGRRRCGCAP